MSSASATSPEQTPHDLVETLDLLLAWPGEAILYTYARNASELFDAVRPWFADFPIRPGTYAVKRFGPATDPNSQEARVAPA